MFFCRKLTLPLLLSCLFLPAVQAIDRQDFVIAIDTGHSPTQPDSSGASTSANRMAKAWPRSPEILIMAAPPTTTPDCP